MNARFGPAGNPDSFYREGHKSSLDMPRWLRERGLNAYEYQCVRGVNIGRETARRLGELAAEYGIYLSIHAPYYVNLAASEEEGREKTKKHLLDSMLAASWMGAGVVVFHPGSARGDRAAAMERAINMLGEVLRQAGEDGLDGILLAPETMGKRSLLGSLDEVLELCGLDERIIPAVDFGHLHAAGGGLLNSTGDFAQVLDRVVAALGRERSRRLHIHFSPVEYTAAGERRHRTTRDSGFGPDFACLAPLLADPSLEFTLICESDGLQAEDALFYKSIYEQAVASGREDRG
ncbi:MAG: TIM barrel protein [Peptococcaceae bacterium]|nr:TIM barrel protein [Peptococcaceae bacterium]